MKLVEIIKYLRARMPGIQRHIKLRLLAQLLILSIVITSCDSDPYGSHWSGEYKATILQYLETNRSEYSKFYELLEKGKLLGTLGAYNPYGNDYTLFLPTDEAITRFIEKNPDYANLEEILLDTTFAKALARYHTINNRLHTDQFPDGALLDSTLTGDRLVTGFYKNGDNLLIKVNNEAQITEPNLEMTNGFIHVISEVLKPAEISGYEWLQQQDGYSILADAMEFCRLRNRLWFNKYTILAEHDSVYHKKGIMNLEDLINYVVPPGGLNSNGINAFYQFTAYHVVRGEYYLNDLHWGSEGYRTLGDESVTINVGLEIQINPGIDTYGTEISEAGDTTVIDYIRIDWEGSNRVTTTGPIHSISNMLSSEPLP